MITDRFEDYCSPKPGLLTSQSGDNLVEATSLLPEFIEEWLATDHGKHAVQTHFSLPIEEQKDILVGGVFENIEWYRGTAVPNALRATDRSQLIPRGTERLAWWNGPNCGPGSFTTFCPSLASYCCWSVGLDQSAKALVFGLGGGFTSVLAANMVGPDGRVVGVDLDSERLSDVAAFTDSAGLHHLTIEHGNALRPKTNGEEFDAVITTLSATSPIPEWFDLLAPGGRLGAFIETSDLDCLFVVYDKDGSEIRRMTGLINSRFEDTIVDSAPTYYPDLLATQRAVLTALL